MDYVDRAIQYAEDAQESYAHGKWSRLACKRFLDDLKRAESEDCPYYFDGDEAEAACAFAEAMPHVEGKWDTPNILLHESMVWFYVNLFGFRSRETGNRRFSKALWASGRKNAKSTGLGAPIGLYCQLDPDDNGAQVYSAATVADQARIVFNVAKAMVDKEDDLQEFYNIKTYANSIAGFSNGSFFKPINAKAKTKDGFNPSCVIVDEVHAHPNHDLINVLESAEGARENPLFLFVTTEGFENGDTPWASLRALAHKVLEGIVEADHFFPVIFSIDDEDDYFDPSVWIKANPLIEVNPILKKAIAKDALEAEHMPSKMAEFKTKRLNIPSEAAESFVNILEWKKTPEVLTLDQLEGHPCWFSLDLSATRDIASFRGVWLVGDEYHTHGWRFLPKGGIHQKNKTGTHIYQSWIEQGLIIETQGETINHDTVQQVIEDCYHRFQPIAMCSDEWNARELIRKLDEKGIEMEIFRQGAKSYHPAIKKFEELYLNKKIAHGNDPVLNWCAANLVTRYDANMNMCPDKKNSANKIDDVVTLLMSIGLSLEYEPAATFDEVLQNRISINL